MTTTSELPMRTAAAITGDGVRCILCDRIWPKDEMPLWHRYVFSETEPVATCRCDGNDEEPRWHGFEVLNQQGVPSRSRHRVPAMRHDQGLEGRCARGTLQGVVCRQELNRQRDTMTDKLTRWQMIAEAREIRDSRPQPPADGSLSWPPSWAVTAAATR